MTVENFRAPRINRQRQQAVSALTYRPFFREVDFRAVVWNKTVNGTGLDENAARLLSSLTWEEVEAAYQDLFRVWVEWADARRLPYWISAESLLGWWWGRRRLPWDFNIHIQIPAALLTTLHDLNSTHIDHINVGESRYRLEVSPFMWFRQADKRNHIDVRLIDTKLGIHLSISALTTITWIPDHIESKIPIRYSLTDIQPLIRTTFEGIPTWIPHTHEKLLENEFGRMPLSRPIWGQYFYDKSSHRWKWMDCTSLFETYVLDAGWYIHRAEFVQWDSNGTHCAVDVRSRRDETKSYRFDGEWRRGRKVYRYPG